MSDTDTPETDAQINRWPGITILGRSLQNAFVESDFARKLERDLTEARRTAETYRDEFLLSCPTAMRDANRLPWES